jgi:cell division protein FtsL
MLLMKANVLLSMSQAEIDSFEQLLISFNEKKEQLRNDLLKLDEQIVEKKNNNDDMKLESELILKKRTVVEQSLQELINSMNQKFIEAKEKRNKIEKEVKGL